MTDPRGKPFSKIRADAEPTDRHTSVKLEEKQISTSLKFFLDLLLFLLVCVHAHTHVCSQPAEGSNIRCPGAGIVGGGKLPEVGAGSAASSLIC